MRPERLEDLRRILELRDKAIRKERTPKDILPWHTLEGLRTALLHTAEAARKAKEAFRSFWKPGGEDRGHRVRCPYALSGAYAFPKKPGGAGGPTSFAKALFREAQVRGLRLEAVVKVLYP